MVHRAGPRGDPSLWAAPPPVGLIPSSVPTATGATVRLGGPDSVLVPMTAGPAFSALPRAGSLLCPVLNPRVCSV